MCGGGLQGLIIPHKKGKMPKSSPPVPTDSGCPVNSGVIVANALHCGELSADYKG